MTNYYAMQASVTRRYAKGLMVNANWTWAHGLGNSSTDTALFTNNSMLQYGNTALDVRHRIAVTASYSIPAPTNLRGPAAYALKGWQVNAIGYWQTSLPFTVVNNTPMVNVPGVTQDRPNQISDWQASKPTLNQWFNTAAFAPQVKGTAGGEAPYQLRGPNQRSLNLSVVRDFALHEKIRLQLRAESFNITNTANFANPGSVLGENGFGMITATSANTTPRQLQFALKLLF